MRVLITDGHTRAALAMTRGLGRAGHTVSVAAPFPRSLGGTSRYCASEHPQAASSEGPQALGDSLRDVIRRVAPEFVVGVTDPALSVLHAAEFSPAPAIVTPPAREPYACASDKVRLFELAVQRRIPVPEGIVVAGGELPSEAALSALGSPVVVRPALSYRVDGARWIRGSVSYEADRATLAARMRHDPALAFPYLVQRYIDGEGCGLFVLASGGALLRVFAHRRLREKPPEGGVSTLCESVAVPSDLLAVAGELLAALDWSGLAMLEFKRDRRNGRAHLLEVNARPWGSLALATAAGVDFPRDLLALVTDGKVLPSDGYRSGISLRWWWGEVDHFYLRAKAEGRSGPVTALRAIGAAALAGPWPDAWDTARLDDPLPFAAETLAWVRA